MDVLRKVGSAASKLQYTKLGKLAYDKGPKLMVIGGVVMMGTAGVRAVVKTPGYVERIEQTTSKREKAVETLKTYGPDVALGVGGAACVLGGNRIIDGRRIAATALAAQYSEVAAKYSDAYMEYRERVREKYGDEVDRDILYDTTEETYTETEVTKKGKEKEVEKTRKVYDSDKMLRVSPYARIFDESNPEFVVHDPVHNKNFLVMVQNYLNQKLQVNGKLFLNEVYQALGFEPTFEGRNIGWSLEKNPFSVVDFGLFDFDYDARMAFWNGAEDAIWLDFNIDGWIADELPREKTLCARREERQID